MILSIMDTRIVLQNERKDSNTSWTGGSEVGFERNGAAEISRVEDRIEKDRFAARSDGRPIPKNAHDRLKTRKRHRSQKHASQKQLARRSWSPSDIKMGCRAIRIVHRV